jgi:hypothetical protein
VDTIPHRENEEVSMRAVGPAVVQSWRCRCGYDNPLGVPCTRCHREPPPPPDPKPHPHSPGLDLLEELREHDGDD